MPVHFLFVDDAIGEGRDAERYKALLTGDGLIVTPVAPSRESLLVPEGDLQPDDLAGFILDINLRDQVEEGGERFLGTGAGLAQDLRLLQASEGAESQRPRPIVRLCAAQVFQQYIAGDNSTADVFDLGFDKETVADIASDARKQIAALPDIYEGIIGAERNSAGAAALLGASEERYAQLHSGFRNAFEIELEKKAHEAANFLLAHLLLRPGILVSEELLAVRLGIDRAKTSGGSWTALLAAFQDAGYVGRGHAGFPRWWMDQVHSLWAGISERPLFGMTAAERVEALTKAGYEGLTPIAPQKESPGDRPWSLSQSETSELRLPVDVRFGYPISLANKPWLDEPLWCLEQAKQQRQSRLLSDATRARLVKDLKAPAAN